MLKRKTGKMNDARDSDSLERTDLRSCHFLFSVTRNSRIVHLAANRIFPPFGLQLREKRCRSRKRPLIFLPSVLSSLLRIEGEERGGINSINDIRGWRHAMGPPRLTSGPRQRRINRALNVPRGDNQFYLMEKEAQEGRGAMMPKTERNSYHTRCAGIFMHVYVGVCTSIVTNLCKGQCPIVAVRGEFVSPIYRLAACLAPITV